MPPRKRKAVAVEPEKEVEEGEGEGEGEGVQVAPGPGAAAGAAAGPSAAGMDAAYEVAQSIIDRKHADGTKKQYRSIAGKFKRFMRTSFPSCIGAGEDDEVFAPLVHPLAGQVNPLTHKHYNDADILTAFLAGETKDPSGPKQRKKKNEDGSAELVPGSEYRSNSHIGSCIAGLQNYFRSLGHPLTKETGERMNEFNAGHKRNVADLRLNGEMPLTEGKKPLTQEAYARLALFAINPSSLKSVGDCQMFVYCHLFLVLTWNMFNRSESTAALMYIHLSWQGDCLFVVTPRSKGDQDGSNSYSKAVFANPLTPSICPILTLAIHEICKPFRDSKAKQCIFQEGSAKQKFLTWMATSCKALEDDMLTLGLDVKEIGGHSIRKGILSSACSQPGGPSSVAIYHRAGWSLGDVQDRYFAKEGSSGSDAQVGRGAAGLPVVEPEFATLPPHFTNPGLSPKAADLRTIFPHYKDYPESFLPVLPFLLASLIYHRKYIADSYPKHHPVHHTVFMQNPDLVAPFAATVETGLRMNSKSKMQATGIPPHVMIAAEMRQAKEETMLERAALQAELAALGAQCTELHGRFAQHEQFVVAEVPQRCVDLILDRIKVDGTNPVTQADLAGFSTTILQEMRQLLAQANGAGAAQAGAAAAAPPPAAAQPAASDPVDPYPIYTWKGALRFVPQTYEFPRNSCSCRDMWLLWHFGEKHTISGACIVRPLRFLEASHFDKSLPSFKSIKTSISKARGVMDMLRKKAVDMKLATSLAVLNALGLLESQDVFKAVMGAVCVDVCGSTVQPQDKEKFGGLTYQRVYDLASKAEKKKKGGASGHGQDEEDEEDDD